MTYHATVMTTALGSDLPAPVAEVLGAGAVRLLAAHTQGARRLEPGTTVTKMMVAGPDGGGAFSFKWRNLLGLNPLNPRAIKEGLAAAAAAKGALALTASAFGAFILAATVLAVRPISREEALVMHMAHRIARADGTFTLADIVAVADELRDGYMLDKVGEADLRAILGNLERAGGLYPTPRGTGSPSPSICCFAVRARDRGAGCA